MDAVILPFIEFDLPHAFSMSKEKVSYEITGIVNHEGINLESGHYTTLLKDDEGSWSFLDDEAIYAVKDINQKWDIEEDPYILFLTRKN